MLLRSRVQLITLCLGFLLVVLLAVRIVSSPQWIPGIAEDASCSICERKKAKEEQPFVPLPDSGPLPEYFPLAASAQSPADLPPVPAYNRPPKRHVPEKTPLYIAFTRYWPLLQQVVVAYIAAGWPPEDIYVVENTGTFDANQHGRLSSQNRFYLDYNRLTKIYGVNVITTPSLQTFSQLQNFFLSEAIRKGLKYYFWGHMDVLPLSHEDREPYKSLYMLAVDTIRETEQADYGVDPDTGVKHEWAIQYFNYDWLSLVNVASYQKLGGWDSMISYYGSDCDMHSRIRMHDMWFPNADAGHVLDVDRSLDDLEILFRRKPKGLSSPKATPESVAAVYREDHLSNSSDPLFPMQYSAEKRNRQYLSDTEEDSVGSERWLRLLERGKQIQHEKQTAKNRNAWQRVQRGGEGEPYHSNPYGWEDSLERTVQAGLANAKAKWGVPGCDYFGAGLTEKDAWRQFKVD